MAVDVSDSCRRGKVSNSARQQDTSNYMIVALATWRLKQTTDSFQLHLDMVELFTFLS